MKKVLIADDSLFMRRVLRGILTDMCRIVEAESGSTALDEFYREDPDLTLLDIIMPEGEEEGIRVLTEIKKTHPAAKVIMITAVGQDEVMKRCKELGAIDYIIKPFGSKQVTDVVKRCLA